MTSLRLAGYMAAILWTSHSAAIADNARPNVLFIAIDDQNDWIGVLHGHPLVQTPNIDRLAARGEVFSNAHCQAPLCNPSRTSVMLSLRPTTTGVYGLAPWFRTLNKWKDRVTLPQHFAAHGYHTYATGKVYHPFNDANQLTAEFATRGPLGGVGAKPTHKLIPPTPQNHPLIDWGTFPHRDQDKTDYQVADWAINQLKTIPRKTPFFMAVGFSLPHVPCYATEKWFKLYPDDDSLLPPVRLDDRDDTPLFSWYLHWRLPEPRLKWVKDHSQWRNLVRSYLACTSFVDAQIGRVLAALDESGAAQNTIVVLWSDHGWHLGEKLITGKNSLWERSTHVPLIFAGPGVPPGTQCSEPVELLDIYPTLTDLCHLPCRNDLEGHSLSPQIHDPSAPRPWPAITSHNQGNHAVRTDRWRYIHYADGSQELYDMKTDPNEWNNLANDPKHAALIAKLRAWLPKTDVPPAPHSASRILTYDKATDEAVWEGKKIHRGDRVPGE